MLILRVMAAVAIIFALSLWLDKDDAMTVLATTACVRYEEFGARGDGVTDDLPAICAAHTHANAQGLRVVARGDACYHLGRQALTALIATDTDWGTARFTLDDTDVEDHTAAVFRVVSLLDSVDMPLEQLQRDQRSVAVRPAQACFVRAENDGQRRYIRRGVNQNDGTPQHDCFIVHPDGSIEGDIDWDYEKITQIEAHPIEAQVLTITGGVFTTVANRMPRGVGANYWERNIQVTRSHTVITGLTHYVAGETESGHPYRGFLSAVKCANIIFQDCFVSGHKIYTTISNAIGQAGTPITIGSYDINVKDIVNFTLRRCTMNHILDRTRWGVTGSNFCKNIVLEDCVLSRMDTHMGVSGHYIIRRCTLGHMGLNAIGRGEMLVEDSLIYGNNVVNFREDYGSIWEGTLRINNCRWVPACGDKQGAQHWPHLFSNKNDGGHDFGYPCFMPQSIEIDGLHIDDSHAPDNYTGPVIFALAKSAATDAQPAFPYQFSKTLRIRNLTCSSGLKAQIADNPDRLAELKVDYV